MPLYDYGCKECNYEWEVQHKLADAGPSNCPKCNAEFPKKLISAVHGSVELTGHELKAKLKADSRALINEASNSEKVMANLVGEDKYQGNTMLRENISKGNFD